MPIGAGLYPAGVSPAGYGVPDSAAVPNNAPLPGQTTGLPQTGRYIDPVTKDYVFTTDGRLQGLATVPQLVQLALTTILGSAAVTNVGQTFTLVQEKGAGFAQQMRAKVTSALSDLVKRNLVQIKSIAVDEPQSSPDAGIVRVRWIDLTTGVEQTTAAGQP
jgi:hypothetical protein